MSWTRKKSVWIIAMLILMVGLVIIGCSGQQQPEPTQTPTPTAEEPPQATLEDAAEFYKGKRIEFVVPNAPGGGYDQYARMLAPYLEKYTGATVVVNNMEGAGGMTSLNYTYRAPKDGLTIAIINGNPAVTNVIAGTPGIVYELDKFSWIGRIVSDPRVLVLRTDSPYETIEEMMNSSDIIKIGATGLGGSTYVDAVIVGEALELPLDVIHGFDSSTVTDQAILRGDVEGTWGSWGSRRKLVDDGLMKVVLQGGTERIADLPDIPTWFEVVKTERGKAILTVLDSLNAIGRPLAASPGIPPERLAFLRQAFDQTMQDPDFLAEAAQAKRDLDYASGERIAEMAVSAVNIPGI